MQRCALLQLITLHLLRKAHEAFLRDKQAQGDVGSWAGSPRNVMFFVGISLRTPKERVEEYVATQRCDALSRRSAKSGALPDDSVPIQLPPLAEFPGLNISPQVSTDFGSNGGLLGPGT